MKWSRVKSQIRENYVIKIYLYPQMLKNKEKFLIPKLLHANAENYIKN